MSGYLEENPKIHIYLNFVIKINPIISLSHLSPVLPSISYVK